MKKSTSSKNARSAKPAAGKKAAAPKKSSVAAKRNAAPSGRASATASKSAKPAPKKSARSAAASSRGTAKSSGSRVVANTRKKQSSAREDLQEVLKDSLKDIYYAEKQLAKALKKVSKAATNEDLKQAFDTHREQTEGQIELLTQAFEALEMRAAGKKCPAMDGLIEEANEHIQEMDKGPALDAALIVGAQKIEHYEIAAYGSMRTFARCLGLGECEDIFNQILQQESETDELLTQIAETVNMEALDEDEAEEVDMGEMEEEAM